MRIPNGSKLLFIGDSITDAGRDELGEPTPWDPSAGLGSGYVNMVNAMIEEAMPDSRIRIINKGISGNTVIDLEARWKPDVLEIKPDWLAVMIGINDVWRQFDTPLRSETHVGTELYEKTLDRLLSKTRKSVRGLVLMTPYFVDPNRSDPMLARMDKYGAIVKRLAEKQSALFVDTQAAFDRVMEHVHPMSIAWDRIHPGATGHMIIAKAFLNTIGFGGQNG